MGPMICPGLKSESQFGVARNSSVAWGSRSALGQYLRPETLNLTSPSHSHAVPKLTGVISAWVPVSRPCDQLVGPRSLPLSTRRASRRPLLREPQGKTSPGVVKGDYSRP